MGRNRDTNADRRGWLYRRVCLIGIAVALLAAGSAHASVEVPAGVEPPYSDESARFGVGGPLGTVGEEEVRSLGARWYLTWGTAADPALPNGVWFMQTLRLEDGVPRRTDAQVRELVRANPGAVWQIGNEPDSIWQDDTEPTDYAAAYHDLHKLITDEDPTALVAIGGLVQATPLRMAYLDRVWEAYLRDYEVPMPVDVWTVHGFILQEKAYSWGAEIPPGMDDLAHLGMDYDLRDHDDVAIFAEQIERFRSWMATRGQQEKPLVVNEYGILMPEDIQDESGDAFTEERVIAFMESTFDYFRSATDGSTGYSLDGNRLVQQWAWYSVDDDQYVDGEQVGERYNGDLFTGAVTKTKTALGVAYGRYVVGDLRVVSLSAPPAFTDGSGRVTATVRVTVAKDGGLSPTEGVEVRLWADGTADGDVVETFTLGPLEDGETDTIEASFSYAGPGGYPLRVAVDPADAVTEVLEGNNGATAVVLVATDRVFLPLVQGGGE